MTAREKLIQILKVPIHPHLDADPAEVVADYLLDNGVTVQETGHWLDKTKIIDGYVDYRFDCSECGQIYWNAGIETFDYCPNCGAMMIGAKKWHDDYCHEQKEHSGLVEDE